MAATPAAAPGRVPRARPPPLQEPWPTGNVCFNDLVAFGAMNALRASGIEPGRDVGIGGTDEAAAFHPALTTVLDNPAKIGRMAVERGLLSPRCGSSTSAGVQTTSPASSSPGRKRTTLERAALRIYRPRPPSAWIAGWRPQGLPKGRSFRDSISDAPRGSRFRPARSGGL